VFPLVAQALELTGLIDPRRDAGVTPNARTTRGDEYLAIADGPDGHLVARVQAGSPHRRERKRDLIL
jgi:hypothetical protein